MSHSARREPIQVLQQRKLLFVQGAFDVFDEELFVNALKRPRCTDSIESEKYFADIRSFFLCVCDFLFHKI